jgi:hypothetical protein
VGTRDAPATTSAPALQPCRTRHPRTRGWTSERASLWAALVGSGHGRARVLVVTTIVWALPAGYWLTSQHAALLTALGGAVLITVANRETQLPGEAAGTDGARTDEALT